MRADPYGRPHGRQAGIPLTARPTSSHFTREPGYSAAGPGADHRYAPAQRATGPGSGSRVGNGGGPTMAAQATGRIVVGIDGSEASTDALRWGARQAELTGSPLEVIMTWEWPASLGWSVPVPDDYDPETDVRRTL